jgi:hypothetical protein
MAEGATQVGFLVGVERDVDYEMRVDKTLPTDGDLPRKAVFGAASGQVMQRVVWRRFWALMLRVGLPILGGVLGLALVWAALGGGLMPLQVAVLAVLLVAVGFFTWIWRGRPSQYAVWALWDREAGRREAFAAAWSYEQRAQMTEGEARHWQGQAQLLPEALGRLRRDLPLPKLGRLVWVGVGLMGIGLTGGWVAAVTRGPTLNAEMLAAALAEAGRLAKLEVKAEKLAALTEAERKQLEAQLQGAAEALAESAGKTAREVLDALEQRAREAEKMAERLGKGDEAWASPELTDALRRQADTADLGDAVADRRGGEAADEAQALAEKMDSAAAEQEERLKGLFEDLNKASAPEDKERLVGRGVAGAAQGLQAGQKAEASAALREMAEQLREQQGRQQTQQELERLAQQLREAGSQVANAGQAGEAMQALTEPKAQSDQTGQSPGEAQSPPDPQAKGQPQGQMMTQAGGTEQGQETQPPSPSPGAAGQPGQQGPQLSLSEANPQAGQGGDKPENGAPMLLAPVPGQDPSEKPPEMAVFMPGNAPPGGASMGSSSALPPGAGSSEVKGEETETLATGQSALTTAQPTGQGASTLRQVEGGAPRDEAVRQGSAALSVEFMEAQEAAMDEVALPTARREQVRRYFNALRKRLEGGGGEK